MGRPPLKKSGAMTNAERLRRHRRKVAREKKLANPKLKAKQERRAERERALALKISGGRPMAPAGAIVGWLGGLPIISEGNRRPGWDAWGWDLMADE